MTDKPSMGPFYTEPVNGIPRTYTRISYANLRIRGVDIGAKRGKTKRSVLMVAFYTKYPKYAKGEKYKEPTYTGMIGIGCDGYGKQEDEREIIPLDEWVAPPWLGVEQTEIDELQVWLAELKEAYEIPFDPPSFERALRFNQGDMFFAGHLGDPAITQATPPGEKITPVLMQMIEGWEKQDDD